MKILCICNHGNVRSACLAREIKDVNVGYPPNLFKYESVAIGAHNNSFNTIKIFCDWADKVIDLSDNIDIVQNNLKLLAGNKYERFDIGNDRWGNPFASDLRLLCQNKIKEWDFK